MESFRYSPSFLLFARPSFLTGFGQVLDLGGTTFMFNESVNGEQADFFAIKADWMAVGRDLQWAIENSRREMAREVATAVP